MAEAFAKINTTKKKYFYYESRKREIKTRLIIYEDWCDERLKN
jgi:hypothetical protein